MIKQRRRSLLGKKIEQPDPMDLEQAVAVLKLQDLWEWWKQTSNVPDYRAASQTRQSSYGDA